MGLRKATSTPEQWAKYLADMRAYNATPEGQARARAWRESHVGYPHEVEYARLLAEQDGVCAICKKPEREGRRLSLDHDHSCCPGRVSCGKCIRGLLCDRCNRALSHLGEDVLAAALDYVQKDRSTRIAA